MQWKNIETAPKDGTRILVANYNDIEIAHWSTDIWVTVQNKEGKWEGQWVVVDARSYSQTINPTHWCELPQLPKKLFN